MENNTSNFAKELLEHGIRSESDIIKKLKLDEKGQHLFRTWVNFVATNREKLAFNSGMHQIQTNLKKLLNIEN